MLRMAICGSDAGERNEICNCARLRLPPGGCQIMSFRSAGELGAFFEGNGCPFDIAVLGLTDEGVALANRAAAISAGCRVVFVTANPERLPDAYGAELPVSRQYVPAVRAAVKRFLGVDAE